MKISPRLIISLIALVVTLSIDQVFRLLALERDVHWNFGAAEFGYFPNTGAIFSLKVPGPAMIVIMVAIVVSLLLLLLNVGFRRGGLFVWGMLALLTAGSANLVDRFRFSAVIDYVSLGPWLPVFNLADVIIILGLACLLMSLRSAHSP